MVDEGAKSVQAKVLLPNSSQIVRDFDGEQLHFRNRARLNPHSCYFHSCCAIWKSTFLEDPSRSAEDFWERYQIRMHDLWGTHTDRQDILNIFKPPELLKSEEMGEREAKVEELVKSEGMDERETKVESVPSSTARRP